MRAGKCEGLFASWTAEKAAKAAVLMVRCFSENFIFAHFQKTVICITEDSDRQVDTATVVSATHM